MAQPHARWLPPAPCGSGSSQARDCGPSPFDSGGYFWLVFDSVRDYGNRPRWHQGHLPRQLIPYFQQGFLGFRQLIVMLWTPLASSARRRLPMLHADGRAWFSAHDSTVSTVSAELFDLQVV